MHNWNVRIEFGEGRVERHVPQHAQFVRLEHPKNRVEVKALPGDEGYA